MSEEIEQKLLRQIAQLQKEMRELKGVNTNTIPTYTFSKIRDKELKKLFDIEIKANPSVFKSWFEYQYNFKEETLHFFKQLIDDNREFINKYSEEDLKVKFIVPLLNHIRILSLEDEFREFYELSITYQTDDFKIYGTTDYVISKGLFDSKKPYFFIQEFKKDEHYGNPEPQLLAELIAGVELNKERMMRGAYIVGSIWRFVILEKLGERQYQYFVSRDFNATRLDDIQDIYKNILFVKEEIIQKIRAEKKQESK